jgi:cellulose synthase/poly-beta-1,6-N-acetylglucosamine synthase-like glycosyltransferase
MTRFFEILPGALAWSVLIILGIFSWRLPAAVAIFIVLYDLYWFLKTAYLFFHLQSSFSLLKKNIAIDWFEKLKGAGVPWENVRHLVVLPMYREPYEVVRESVSSLAATNYPKDKFLVVLATEERGGEESQLTARKVEAEFGTEFGGFLTTTHPADIPGELMGKGANETWALKQAVRDIVEAKKIPIDDVLVSVFDVDTRPGPDYFAILTHKFLTVENSRHSSFQPIPFFTNNIHNVPVFARLIAFTTTFWQFMQQARPEQLVTFSSHSTPLRGLIDVGFWHTHIVSEDSRIFFQLLDRYNGDWRVIPLVYPIYMDAVEGTGFWGTMKNLYKQQRRWAWGSENIAFVFSSFINNKKIPIRKKIYWSFLLIGGFCSWPTSSLVIFLFGIMPILLGGPAFQQTVLSYNLPKVTGLLMNLSMIGIVVSAGLSILLLLPHMKGFKIRHYFVYFFQWFLMPITLIFFASIPALEAETRLMLSGRFRLGFWNTPKKIVGGEK